MNDIHPQDPVACRDVAESLPWFLNGTLEATEMATLKIHLANCAACRQELAKTAQAWDIFTTHVPSLDVARLAHGLPAIEIDTDVAERHLAHCASCRDELTEAGKSRPTTVRPAVNTRPKRLFRQRALMIAASLTVVLISGSLLYHDRPADPPMMARVEDPTPEKISDPSTIFVSSFESGDLSGWQIHQ